MARHGTSVIASATSLMVVAAIPTFFLAVFAPQIMAQFDIGHAQLGLLISLIYASASVLAHKAGDLVDRRGATLGGEVLLVSGAVTMAIFAWSPSYLLLLPASVVAGVALAVSNPATNIAVRQGLSGRLQRSAMGIKQGGVPLAVVLAGGVLPSLAGWVTWRGVAAVLGVVTLIGLVPWTLLSNRRNHWHTSGYSAPQRLAKDDSAFRLLRRYALAMGGLAGLLNTFYVVFVVNELQWSAVEAGWVAAVTGTTGAIARWLWVEVAGRTARLTPVIFLMTAVGCVGTAAMWSAQYFLAPMVWFAAVLLGASVMGWQGFVMQAVASKAPPSAIGQESGRVMQQFYLGLLVTPFSVGWAIEQSSSYAVLWTSQTLLFILALGPVWLLSRLERATAASESASEPGRGTAHGSPCTPVPERRIHP